LKVQYQMFNFRCKHISANLYNAQIIKDINFEHYLSQFIFTYVESSMSLIPVSKANEHITVLKLRQVTVN